MKAIVIKSYGDEGVVEYTDIERPKPNADEVLVKVQVAGVNPIDWKIRGGVGKRLGLTLPITLGGEIAGTIETIGNEVKDFKEGDAVYGIIASGGYAEYAIAKVGDIASSTFTSFFLEGVHKNRESVYPSLRSYLFPSNKLRSTLPPSTCSSVPVVKQ